MRFEPSEYAIAMDAVSHQFRHVMSVGDSEQRDALVEEVIYRAHNMSAPLYVAASTLYEAHSVGGRSAKIAALYVQRLVEERRQRKRDGIERCDWCGASPAMNIGITTAIFLCVDCREFTLTN